MFNLKGKTALVAGGLGLLGTPITDALRKQGASTLVIDIKEGADFVFDISDRNLYDQLFDNMERCDVFVNMAYPAGVIPHMKAFYVSSLIMANWMKTNNGGVIINASSIYGVIGSNPSLYDGTDMQMPAGYAFNKAGIIGLTKWIATNFGRYGIRANCVCPGGVYDAQPDKFWARYNKQVPLDKEPKFPEISTGMVDLNSIAQTVVYLACCEDITGQAVVVDGGLTAW
jgi:NAD(P)-dependent dehydrogenase (short-subunit alcohol dehydrogenase family)